MNDHISRRRFLGASAAVTGISLTSLGSFYSAAAASDEVHGFEASGIAGETAILPYRLFKPDDYQDGRQFPLVLTLHGAGKRGTDNKFQVYNNALIYSDSRVQSFQPTFVVSPQCPDGKSWVDVTGWDEGARPLREMTDPMATVVELLDDLIETYPIDPDRQHVAGYSMGGYGTWDLISRFPNRFEAATPMSGGGVPERAAELEDVRVWAFHGEDDPIVPVRGTREMIRAMQDAGLEPKYTEFTGVGHTADPALRTDGLAEWMLRDPETPPIAPQAGIDS
ncbi:carboxylesterase family protein [Natronorubrum halophilum]|uniref:carboxylesterase family protein n=1 Tax=Natronorubrum halophilum TaxID=1702106 RepID=UPI0010C1A135|nr:alpha/beta hydrolase-fold protein [Natronorubrum halophilum]